MAKVRRKIKAQAKTVQSPFKNYWTNTNYMILGAGIVVLFIGFLLMAQGPWDNPLSMTISPLVLLVAYLVIFPLSIFYKKRKKAEE